MPVDGVLLDVGGTLWPDRWTERPDDRKAKAARIAQLAGQLDGNTAAVLVDQLEEACADVIDGGPQPTTDTVAAVVARAGLRPQLPDPTTVCRALSLPFAGQHALLPGAATMVRRLRAEGLRLVVISNTIFRDSYSYWQDFADAGLADCLSGIVTSIDVGWRKPHPAIFRAALDALALPAERAAMVGNSETSDIIPAAELNLTTIRVAIEESAPDHSQAGAVVTSLGDVPAALHRVAVDPSG
jgi:putative hydrolase of the HAD superfamily